ncbi:hypothetical protein ACIRVF_01580 [Kitasatospora sp. NPDC101157]|uniref:hypothetical protein n=1 Tax=Kitasatospora sp. NPDC101157 TaxID=3364098 RepID=UPI00380625D6
MSDRPANGGGFQIDTDLLRQAAGKAGEAAAPIPGQTGALLDASQQAVAGLRGLDCGTALDDCTGAWHLLLNGLHATMDGHGRNLEAAARRYRGADRQSGAGFAPTVAQRRNFVRHFG